jgi:hypothetical protein
VVRRPAADKALSELPIEMRPAVLEYVAARRAEHDARQALSSLMTRFGYRWREVDALATKVS